MAHIIASSPLSSAPFYHRSTPVTSSQQMREWKESKELPFELAQHVQIYFEESMFIQAYRLLLSITTSDASSGKDTVTVPPPHHLALTSTLTVHPSVTTRTFLQERHEQAASAMRLLRLLQKIAGPVHSRFREAFTFTKYEDRSIGDVGDDGNDESGHHRLQLNHSFAQEDSIWNRADDFWAVVGWALNCSCLSGMYKLRWQHWQMWFHFMVDVLETDWQYHSTSDNASASPQSSLVWQYIRLAPGGTVQTRRFVRAIFADGSTVSLNEFREVFKSELKQPKQEKKEKSQRREAVDIDNEVYADYLVPDDSDTSSENESRPQKRTRTTLRRVQNSRRVAGQASNSSVHADSEGNDDDTESGSTPSLGPPESITLRLQLMQLLVQAGSFQALTILRPAVLPSLTDIYTLFVEFTKPLPLHAFEQFVTPPPPSSPPTPPRKRLNISTPTTGLNIQTYITFVQFLLQRLLELFTDEISPDPNANFPSPSSNSQTMSQSTLETKYLPFASNKPTTDANARTSLCLEGLLRVLCRTGTIRWSQDLERSVEMGIIRRSEGGGLGRKGKNENEDEAYACFVASTKRLRAVVAGLKNEEPNK